MSAERRGAAPNKQRIDFRSKMGEFKWRGMAPDFEPQDLSPDRPRFLFNCRLENGGIVGRGGALEEVMLGDTVTGMSDHQIGTQISLYMTSAGCPGFSPSAGFWIGTYDTEQDPKSQRLTYYNTATFPGVFGTFGDDIYFGVDDILMRLQNITPPYGEESLSISGVSQENVIWNLPTGYDCVTAIGEFEGYMYVALQGTVTTNSAIFKYDGVTFTLELGGINPVTGFANFRELLVAGHNGVTSNLIRVRTSAGVWSTVAPGSGTVALIGHSSKSYKDHLYIPFGPSIFDFNGTTLTEIPFATNGMTATASCSCVEVAFGYLYFSWWDSTGVKVGRFDGTTWIGTNKNLTSQFTLIAGETRTLRLYRGSLVVIVKETANVGILISPRENVPGVWVREDLSVGGTVVTITDTVVF
jgi:hypothetical protein